MKSCTSVIFLRNISFLMFITYTTFAQDRPSFLPEDVESKSLALYQFSRPGVSDKSRSRGLELSWIHIPGTSLKKEDDFLAPDAEINSIQDIVFKLKAPIVLKDDLRILFGYNYRPERYSFKSVGQNYAQVFSHIDDRWLKSQQASLFVNKSLNEKHYLTFRVKVSFNGDYDRFVSLNSDYRVFSAAGLWGTKKDENTEWGIGINFSNSFRNTIAIPFFMYNKNFNNRFGIELALPALANFRCNINPETIFLLGAVFSSKSYAIEVPETDRSQQYSMNHSEIRIPLRIERKIHSWFWVDGQIGYQYNFSTDFEAGQQNTFQVEPKSSPYFKIGIFLSPPDDFDL